MSKNSYALQVTEGNKISNLKIHLKTAYLDETRSISKLTNSETSEIIYNATLNSSNFNNSFREYDFYSYENALDEVIKDKLPLIVYYGYGYKHRNTNKWYGITQYLIWEEIIKNENGEIYFVDDNNNPVNFYEEEIKEIRNDIAHHYDLPSFSKTNDYDTYNITLADKLVFEDTNGILQNYNIILGNNVDLSYKIKGNEITITPNNPTYGFIHTTRKIEEFPRNMQYYTDFGSQKFISRGDFSRYLGRTLINVRMPIFKIQNNIFKENHLSVEGYEYKIYTENDIEWMSLRLNKDGISNECNIMPGKYYIIETNPTYGYESSSEKKYFEIKKEDLTFEITSNPIKKHVTIKHQLIDEFHHISLSSNKVLSIYDIENNLVKEITTNEEGKATIDLAYGTYKIIEKDSLERISKETIIKVDENFNEDEIIIIEEEITSDNDHNQGDNPPDHTVETKPTENEENNTNKGTIIINKIDRLTGKPLANLKYGLYNQNYELINEGVTDSNGKLIFKDLATGTYYIKEILKEDDKEFNDAALKVDVKESVETIITSTNRSMIEVPDTRLNSINFPLLISINLLSIGIISLNNVKNIIKKEIFN